MSSCSRVMRRASDVFCNLKTKLLQKEGAGQRIICASQMATQE